MCIRPMVRERDRCMPSLFAVIVNVLMRRQIRRINMAESLKAVE